jgi:hypothetical protein
MAFLLVFENESGAQNIYAWCDNIWNNNSKNNVHGKKNIFTDDSTVG